MTMSGPIRPPIQLMAFPFRIAPNGFVATVLDDTDEEYAQELEVLIGTHLGERHLVPQYGVEDLAFDPTPITTVAAQVEKFGPPVEITNITINDIDEEHTDIEVDFDQITADTANADYLYGI